MKVSLITIIIFLAIIGIALYFLTRKAEAVPKKITRESQLKKSIVQKTPAHNEAPIGGND